MHVLKKVLLFTYQTHELYELTDSKLKLRLWIEQKINCLTSKSKNR